MTSEEIADLENLTSRENAKEQEYQQTKQAKEDLIKLVEIKNY